MGKLHDAYNVVRMPTETRNHIQTALEREEEAIHRMQNESHGRKPPMRGMARWAITVAAMLIVGLGIFWVSQDEALRDELRALFDGSDDPVVVSHDPLNPTTDPISSPTPDIDIDSPYPRISIHRGMDEDNWRQVTFPLSWDGEAYSLPEQVSRFMSRDAMPEGGADRRTWPGTLLVIDFPVSPPEGCQMLENVSALAENEGSLRAQATPLESVEDGRYWFQLPVDTQPGEVRDYVVEATWTDDAGNENTVCYGFSVEFVDYGSAATGFSDVLRTLPIDMYGYGGGFVGCPIPEEEWEAAMDFLRGGRALGQLSETERYNYNLLDCLSAPAWEKSLLAIRSADWQDETTHVAPEGQYALGASAQVDLDGDGTLEMVTVEIVDLSEGWGSLRLRVNGESTEFFVENPLDEWMIFDLDPLDGKKEIVISEEGPSSDPWSRFFGWEDGSIVNLCEAPDDYDQGLPILNTNLIQRPDGRLAVFARASILQSWFYLIHYRLDDNHRIVEVPEALYKTVNQCFLARDLEVYRNPDKSGGKVTLPEGRILNLVATDDVEWIQVVAWDESGETTEGYLWVTNYDYTETGGRLVSLREYLVGLSYFD